MNNFGCPKYGGSLINLQCVTNLTSNNSIAEKYDYDAKNDLQFISND